MKFNLANRRFNLATKFILLISSLIIITSLIIAIFVIRNQRKQVYSDLLDYGTSIAAMIAQNSEYGIYTEDEKTLQQIADNAGKNSDIAYVALLKDRKYVLKEKVINPSVQIPTALRDKNTNKPEQILYADFVNKKDGYNYIDILAPVVSFATKDSADIFMYEDQDKKLKVIGYVQIVLSQNRLRLQVSQFILSTVWFTSLFVLLGIALTVFITKKITLPLRELNMATRDISMGNFDHNVDIHTTDEIADLSQSFNAMREFLKSYRNQVIEITSKLTDANQAMRLEINERKRTEKKLLAIRIKQEHLLTSLRNQEKFSDIIFNSAASGIMVLDKEGHVLKINLTGMAILQINIPDIVGKKITDMYPEAREMLSISAEIDREISVSLPDGSYIPVGFLSSPFADSAEGNSGIIIIFRDITEIKKLNAELKENQRFETMGKIVAGVAHEVRNPLFGIMSICQIMEREVDSPQHRVFMQAALKETIRLKDLIAKLLAYTKPPLFYIEDIHVLTLVQELAPYVNSKKDNINFLVNIPPSLKISAARDKIKHVFYSLLDNAIDAASSTITISGKTLEDIVEITIKDDGNGIKKEDMGCIFDPFFTSKGRRPGLGLSICKKIMEDHDGTIKVQSSEGEGTTVLLSFKT